MIEDKGLDALGMTPEELGDAWPERAEHDAEFRKKLDECGARLVERDFPATGVEEYYQAHK